VKSVKPFIKDPRDVERVLVLLRGGTLPDVDALHATQIMPAGVRGA